MPGDPSGPGWLPLLALLLAATATAVALSLRPWRALPPTGPPWPWLLWWVVLPALWSVERFGSAPLAQPVPGACLLVLMAGWPLAMLALPVAALASALWDSLSWAEAAQRLLWLGVLPASIALLWGWAQRRWLPHHLFVFILGRGFFATLVADALAGLAQALLQPAPEGLAPGDVLIARWLVASADAFLTGMVVAIFVAFRPHWLATYADRIYLPARERG